MLHLCSRFFNQFLTPYKNLSAVGASSKLVVVPRNDGDLYGDVSEGSCTENNFGGFPRLKAKKLKSRRQRASTSTFIKFVLFY